MNPSSHPSDAVLADYASGALRPAFATVTAAHLEHCAHCRSKVETFEAAGLALIEQIDAEPASADWAERVMAALDDGPPPPAAPAASTLERIPFGAQIWLAPGMSVRKAKIDGPDLLYMLKLPAGVKTLPHGHCGTEFTTVLKGAYVDGHQTLAAGDFCELDASVEHQPEVVPGSECICLIASERPMEMQSPLGRVVQVILGV